MKLRVYFSIFGLIIIFCCLVIVRSCLNDRKVYVSEYEEKISVLSIIETAYNESSSEGAKYAVDLSREFVESREYVLFDYHLELLDKYSHLQSVSKGTNGLYLNVYVKLMEDIIQGISDSKKCNLNTSEEDRESCFTAKFVIKKMRDQLICFELIGHACSGGKDLKQIKLDLSICQSRFEGAKQEADLSLGK
jgi:hypothetical protein